MKRLNLGAGPQLEEELKRLKRRIMRLNALKSGDAFVKKQRVEGGWVRRHFRKDHVRAVIVMRKDATR